MKKLIMLSIVALLCLSAMAQDRNGVAIGVNLTGNLTAYTAITDRVVYSEQFRPNVGYGAGLFITIPVAQRLNIQAEVQYDVLRSSLNPRPMTQPMGANRAYSKREYMTVPLMMQYEVGKKYKFFINFGPMLKFSLSSRYRLEFDERYYAPGSDTPVLYPKHTMILDQKENENRMVFALVAGFGMKIPIAKRVDFVCEARLSGDVSRVIDPNNNYYLNGTQAINLALRAGVAYSF